MVPAAQAAALERLADTTSLERPAPARRMLVIANPYATSAAGRGSNAARSSRSEPCVGSA